MLDEPAATGPAGRCDPGAADAPGPDQRHLRADPHGAGHGTAKRAEIPPRSMPRLGRQVVVEGGFAGGLRGPGHSAGLGRALRRLALHTGHDETRDALAERIDQLVGRGSPAEVRREDRAARLLRRRQPFRRVRSRSGRRQPARTRSRPGLRTARQPRRVPFALRLAGHGLQPGLGPVPRAAGEVRDLEHPAARRRSGAGLRPAGHAGGRRLSGRHGPGRQLRHGQPPADQRPGAGSLPGGLPGHDGQLVYFISHNIARKEVVDRPAGVGPSQGSHAGVSRPATTP